MRFLAVWRKTFLENLREWKVLILALAFAPGFVFLMKAYFVAATPAYAVLVVDRDSQPDSAALVEAWRAARHPDGAPVFSLTPVTDLDAGRAVIARREADLLVVIEAGFSRDLEHFRDAPAGPPARLVNHADARNVRGSMAMALSDYVAFEFAATRTQAPMPLAVSVDAVGGGATVDDFTLFVPALLVLGIIMVLFTAATSLVKEVERRTMTRLVLSRLRLGEFFAAVAVNQVFVGLAALGLAWGAAWLCGYRSAGSIGAVLVVGAAASLGVVALAVVTSAFLRTMFELLTVGTFPFFILMFFSECMFPLPRLPVFTLAGHVVYANDVLPTTLGVRALGRILNFGASIGDVAFELGLIGVLTAGYFVLGAWLFRRRQLAA